jgi:hypothetical protein
MAQRGGALRPHPGWPPVKHGEPSDNLLRA